MVNSKRWNTKRIDYWAVWIRKLSSTVLREGIYSPIPTAENKPFDREILKLRRLGLIKPLNIGNKLYPLLPIIILKHRIGWRSQDVRTLCLCFFYTYFLYLFLRFYFISLLYFLYLYIILYILYIIILYRIIYRIYVFKLNLFLL